MDINITPYELTNEMEKYKKFIHELMDFLNPYITPMNPCSIIIDVYNPYNYAEFRRPNIITVYLGSVINNFWGSKPEKIMSILAVCITHELYHAYQNIDMLRYTYDKDYNALIEQQAEYMAEQFVLLNAELFKTKFGFDPTDWIKSYTKRPEVSYENFQLREFYIDTLVAIVFRNEDARKTLEKWFDRREGNFSQNLAIVFEDNDDEIYWHIIIRHGEEYIQQSVQEFCTALNYLYRRGTAAMKFKISCALCEDGSILITTKNKTYRPVEFF